MVWVGVEWYNCEEACTRLVKMCLKIHKLAQLGNDFKLCQGRSRLNIKKTLISKEW